MYRVRCCNVLSITTPGPPVFEVMVVTNNFETETFSILLSWDVRNATQVEISLNTTLQPACTSSTTECVLEGEYNIPYLINITAINCAGAAEELVRVFEGTFIITILTLYMYMYSIYLHLPLLPYIKQPLPSAGCSPPTPPVNGSVSGFTSSRIGAQVTYHCDTDLVLVGERVATCSQSSLQWLSNSQGVVCSQPQGTCTCLVITANLMQWKFFYYVVPTVGDNITGEYCKCILKKLHCTYACIFYVCL